MHLSMSQLCCLGCLIRTRASTKIFDKIRNQLMTPVNPVSKPVNMNHSSSCTCAFLSHRIAWEPRRKEATILPLSIYFLSGALDVRQPKLRNGRALATTYISQQPLSKIFHFRSSSRIVRLVSRCSENWKSKYLIKQVKSCGSQSSSINTLIKWIYQKLEIRDWKVKRKLGNLIIANKWSSTIREKKSLRESLLTILET